MIGLNDLNKEQLEAVQSTEGYVRVIAGAGSGKTRLLVNRYAYLVEDYGIDPSNILCVTFTNKAAGEMKKRIRKLIGEGYDTSLICTYHGFCARLIREDCNKLFLPRDYTILDQVGQKRILSEIYRKYELRLDHTAFEQIIKKTGVYKTRNYTDYVAKQTSPDDVQIMAALTDFDSQIMEDYMQSQKAVGALDFNDLICFALYLLETSEEVRDKWQDRLNYIQVDEFQDSSETEMKLLELLSGKYRNLMIVGDPDQNIYQWRGSDVRLLVDFDKGHTPTQTLFLNRNYRSTPQILKCANTLIDKNTIRLKKELYTEQPDGAEVLHYHIKSDEKEAEQIAQLIKENVRDKGMSYTDHAVLYRMGSLSRVIEKKLAEQSVPYEIYGGVKFFQRMEILDMIAYLRVAAFGDDDALKRIINKPRRRFGREKLARLTAIYENEPKASLYETLKAHINEAPFKDSSVSELINTIENARQNSGSLSLSELIDRIAADSGYEKYIRELGDEERLGNYTEFKTFAHEYENDLGEDVTLGGFLQQISLRSAENEDSERDTVKLMTIHASKGLEFPAVFVVGLSEGIFPSSKTIEERKLEGLEEERRLCYVAITRAQKQLYFTDSEGASPNGAKKLPSRFLDEIGKENYRRIGAIPKELERAVSDRRTVSEFPQGQSEKLKEGDEVTHHIFGKGKIIGHDRYRRSFKVQFYGIVLPRSISESYFSTDHTAPALSVNQSRYIEVEQSPKIMYEDPPEQQQPLALPDQSGSESGWRCVGVEDLGSPSMTCEYCGHQVIRYVHHMVHPVMPPLNTGCVCAGKLEGNLEAAKERERRFKNRQQRLETLGMKVWKTSSSGNPYLR